MVPSPCVGRHGGDAVRYLMDVMDGMDDMDRATARVAPTASGNIRGVRAPPLLCLGCPYRVARIFLGDRAHPRLCLWTRWRMALPRALPRCAFHLDIGHSVLDIGYSPRGSSAPALVPRERCLGLKAGNTPMRIPLGHWAFRVGYWIFTEGFECPRSCASGNIKRQSW